MFTVSIGLTLHARTCISLSLAPYLKIYAAFFQLEDTKKEFKVPYSYKFVAVCWMS